MFKNYLKTAFRNLLKNKVHSFINITGLSVGMAVAILIGLWIWDELTYDRYFKHHDRIAQVLQNQNFSGTTATWWSMPPPTAATMRDVYGGYFKYALMSSWTSPHILSLGETQISKSGNFIEEQAPEMFSLKMLKGTRAGLKDPHSILLSASLAKAFFGDKDPMDQLLKIDNTSDVKVTGVYEDFPSNTTLAEMSYMLPWKLFEINTPQLSKLSQPWGVNAFQTFVQIADNVTMEQASAQIRNIRKDRGGPKIAKFNPQFFLHPMNRWHLYSDFNNGVNTGGRITFVWLFGIIGVFVLLLACINFMNLSTARSEKRAKEVGIRKAVGSFRTQLISQFFCESLLMAAIAFAFSIILTGVLLPVFNEIAGKKISMPVGQALFWIAGIGFSVLTGLLAGSYPALYLSSFRPVKVLKGTFRAGRFAATPRRALVVLQFTVSVMLIIGTLTVFRQIQYAKDRPMGYNSDGLVMVQLMTEDLFSHFDAIRQELKGAGAITEMAGATGPVTAVWATNGGFDWKGKDPDMAVDIPNTGVSYDYGKTVGWQFVAGRDFSRDFASDSSAFVVNESAVKFMGLKDPVGETIKWDEKPFKIVGVIKDMIMESPYASVRPSFFRLAENNGSHMIMRLNQAGSTSAALGRIEEVFKKYSPAMPFKYQFADDVYARKFDGEARIGKLAGGFAVLAIFISCLGLFGMAAFTAEQRTKEIGVRKVLGASVLNVWQLLSKEFVVLVTISFVIATPLAYLFMQNWLQHYEYRSGIPWWIFMLTAAGALLITLITVSGQSIKAALMNPVKSLRSE